MSRPRQVLPGATYLITRRTLQRQFLLRPSWVTNCIIRYCLGLALLRFPLALHAYCFLSNHYHLVLTDPDGRLPEFMRYLNEMIARSINVLLGRRENLWAPGSYSAVRLMTPEDVVDKTAYCLANPVAAGLVSNARHWPGVWSDLEAGDGRARVARRPLGFFRPAGPTPETCSVRLTTPQGFDSWEDFKAAVRSELARRECEARESVRQEGRSFLGVRRVKAQSTTARPSSVEPRRTLNPRIAAQDVSVRVRAIGELKAFLAAHGAARERVRSGSSGVLFPAGTYLMHVRYGQSVAAAPS